MSTVLSRYICVLHYCLIMNLLRRCTRAIASALSTSELFASRAHRLCAGKSQEDSAAHCKEGVQPMQNSWLPCACTCITGGFTVLTLGRAFRPPPLQVKAGPRDGDAWIARLKEEYASLIAYIQVRTPRISRVCPAQPSAPPWTTTHVCRCLPDGTRAAGGRRASFHAAEHGKCPATVA